jgi:hypothetical protein
MSTMTPMMQRVPPMTVVRPWVSTCNVCPSQRKAP